MSRSAGRWLPVLLWAAAIFALSSRSHLPRAPLFLGWDKLQHGLGYALGGVLLARALYPGRRSAVLALALGSLYGLSDEIHQSFVPLRSPDPRDWLADTLGVLAGIALFHLFLARRGRARPTPPAAHAEPVTP
jgi:VanZ family protein